MKRMLVTRSVAVFLVCCILAACGGASIDGDPANSVIVGETYDFTPTTTKLKEPQTFSITNKPSWATFDTATGRLQGTPSEDDVGTYPGIVISVTAIPEGESASKTLSLDAFSIAVIEPAVDVVIDVSVYPDSGDAPLKSYFEVNTNLDKIISEYHWDFDNDGEYDQVTHRTGQTFNTYVDLGSYEAKVKLVMEDGQEYESNTVSIDVSQRDLDRNIGLIFFPVEKPVKVNETAQFGVHNAQELNATKVEMDINGDGEVDYTAVRNPVFGLLPITSYTFTEPGVYTPAATVYFNDITSVSVPFLGTDLVVHGVGTPIVNIANLDDEVIFVDGYVSNETHSYKAVYEGITSADITLIEWFVGDYSKKIGEGETLEYVYTEASDTSLLLRITTTEAQTYEDKLPVLMVGGQYNYALEQGQNGVIDLGAPSAIQMILTVNNPMRFRALIEDKYGQDIKTLIDWTEPSGQRPWTYAVSWDGKDQSGVLQEPGTYYAVIDYEQDSHTKRYIPYDASIISGSSKPGAGYNFQEFVVGIDYAAKFAPFHNDPLKISFELDHPARLAGFSGILSGARFRSLMNTKVFPAGEHEIYWAGVDDNDVFVESVPDDELVHAVWGAPHPQFPLYISNDPVLSRLVLSNEIFNPQFDKVSNVTATLDRQADLVWTITHSETGRQVYEREYADHAPGNITLTWDGKTESGALVGNGKYTHRLVAANSNGKSIIQNIIQRVVY